MLVNEQKRRAAKRSDFMISSGNWFHGIVTPPGAGRQLT